MQGEKTYICFCSPRNSKGRQVDMGRYVELPESYIQRWGIGHEEFNTKAGKTNINNTRIATIDEVRLLEKAHPKTKGWNYSVYGAGDNTPEQIKEIKKTTTKK